MPGFLSRKLSRAGNPGRRHHIFGRLFTLDLMSSHAQIISPFQKDFKWQESPAGAAALEPEQVGRLANQQNPIYQRQGFPVCLYAIRSDLPKLGLNHR
jgi:hypothetical protein